MQVRDLLEGEGLRIGTQVRLTVLEISDDAVLLEITERGVAGAAGDAEGAAVLLLRPRRPAGTPILSPRATHPARGTTPPSGDSR
jgi:hypothetical protein